MDQHTPSAPAPRFKPLPKPSHTIFTPEQLAEDCEYQNRIEQTPLGEQINRSLYSVDGFEIFDPDCKAIERNGRRYWQFTEIEPGEPLYFRPLVGEPDHQWLEVYGIWHPNELLGQLLEHGASFQLIAAPGTDRETRVRVKPTGAIQRFTPDRAGRLRSAETPFSLRFTEVKAQLMHRASGTTVIKWVDENAIPTGEQSRAREALLSQEALQFAGDLFYALNALDAETLATYGRIIGECCVCSRKLRDANSIQRGVGPDCWRLISSAMVR
jgi:hypothetical protein